MQISLAFGPGPAEITDVLGRVRPVERRFESGEWLCPFCGYGVDPSKPCRGRAGGYAADCDSSRGGAAHCQNPACVANVHYPVERALADVRAEEERAGEARRRAELDEWRRERGREEERERASRVEAIKREAAERGACLPCALADYRHKLVKHRGPCPREKKRSAA